MATKSYKQPKKVASPTVGAADVKETLKRPQSQATVRSADYPATKTTGVKQRGHGAAVKGYTSRGPLG